MRHFFCKQALQCHNSLANWARELFKPSTDLASLLIENEKQFYVLGFSVGNATSGGVFVFFCQHYLAMDASPISQFWQFFFLETRLLSMSSETLIGFLTYLEPNVWPQNKKLVKIYIPTNADPGYSYHRHK